MHQLKVHLALNVNDVEESVKFYRAMFAAEPVKHKPGYAKFDIADPALNLTLNYTGPVGSSGALNHLGIQVGSTDDVSRQNCGSRKRGSPRLTRWEPIAAMRSRIRFGSPTPTAIGGNSSWSMWATPNPN